MMGKMRQWHFEKQMFARVAIFWMKQNVPPFVDDRFHFIMCPPDALKQIMPVLYIKTHKSQWDQG
jgi:hypothetical protein